MKQDVFSVWFWQRIVSPHMAGLASALAKRGCQVVYVAEQPMTEDPALQGWGPPDLVPAQLELAPSKEAVRKLVERAPPLSIHICQGIRGNGLVSVAQTALAERRLRQWVVMETVEDTGWRGIIKRFEYRRLFAKARPHLDGVLATGALTPTWVVARGVAHENVFPFAYFLPDGMAEDTTVDTEGQAFRFIYVGQFIERKRVDLLITSLSELHREFELTVIGSGPLEQELQDLAHARLSNRVRWMGQMSITAVPKHLSQADCLVLPSRHDGWGAVVSEALMAGTPAICSDSCGSAEVVRASGIGGVFRAGNGMELTNLLQQAVDRGRVNGLMRTALARWATSLGAQAGAEYLQELLEHRAGVRERPVPPWHNAHQTT